MYQGSSYNPDHELMFQLDDDSKERFIMVAEVDDSSGKDKLIRRHVVQVMGSYHIERLEKAFGRTGVKIKREGKSQVLAALRLPTAFARFKTVVKRPLVCGYHATEGYLRALHGVNLGNEDRDFYELHHLVEPMGLPFYATPQVIQELIEPYNMRISKIRMVPGLTLVDDAEIRKWARILGCNPIGYGDRATSNAEFAEQMGMPLAEVNARYGFEYCDEPLRPSIYFGAFQLGTQNTYGGGHASYYGPRSRAPGEDYMVTMQLTRSDVIPWPYGAPEFPVVDADEHRFDKQELNLYDSWSALPADVQAAVHKELDKSRFPLATPQAPKGVPWQEPGSRRDGGPSRDGWGKPVPLSPTAQSGAAKFDNDTGWMENPHSILPNPALKDAEGSDLCNLCQSTQKKTRMMKGNICVWCWRDLWRGHECGHCLKPLGLEQLNVEPPELVRVDSVRVAPGEKAMWYIVGKCPFCTKDTFLAAKLSKVIAFTTLYNAPLFSAEDLSASIDWWGKNMMEKLYPNWKKNLRGKPGEQIKLLAPPGVSTMAIARQIDAREWDNLPPEANKLLVDAREMWFQAGKDVWFADCVFKLLKKRRPHMYRILKAVVENDIARYNWNACEWFKQHWNDPIQNMVKSDLYVNAQMNMASDKYEHFAQSLTESLKALRPDLYKRLKELPDLDPEGRVSLPPMLDRWIHDNWVEKDTPEQQADGAV